MHNFLHEKFTVFTFGCNKKQSTSYRMLDVIPTSVRRLMTFLFIRVACIRLDQFRRPNVGIDKR